jgi:hypothetical protein
MQGNPYVTEAAVRKVRGEYEHQVSLLPDLSDTEQKEVVQKCVAYFQNHCGEGISPAGIVNLANGVRSRRPARQEQADWRLKDLARQSADWVAARYPEVKP